MNQMARIPQVARIPPRQATQVNQASQHHIVRMVRVNLKQAPTIAKGEVSGESGIGLLGSSSLLRGERWVRNQIGLGKRSGKISDGSGIELYEGDIGR